MTANGWFQIGLYLVILLAITKPMGVFMTRVFSSEKTFLDTVMRPIEKLLYRMCGIDEKREMVWSEYTIAMLLLGAVSMILLYVIERVQQVLPFNPQHSSNGKTTTQTVTDQVIAQSPIVSQEAIKEFGTNGGGPFNANSAHPYENPAPFTNFLQLLLIFAIPAGLTYTLGRMTGSQRPGWAVWAAMALLFLAGVTVAYWAEARGNPLLHGIDQHVGAMQPGGNMEGKFGAFCHGHYRRELRMRGLNA